MALGIEYYICIYISFLLLIICLLDVGRIPEEFVSHSPEALGMTKFNSVLSTSPPKVFQLVFLNFLTLLAIRSDWLICNNYEWGAWAHYFGVITTV